LKNLETPKIVGKRETRLSKWMTVVERDVLFPGSDEKQTYHSVRPYDYVSILAVTKDQRIPLVRQYRPVLEAESLELPGGLMDLCKTPEETAQIELREETGLVAPVLESLGVLNTDPGRLENRFYCFFASNAEEDATATIENGIKLVWVDLAELRNMILDGRFNSSLQIALIAMASLRGFIRGF
jgi:ADP-ribose pyrophosphatase